MVTGLKSFAAHFAGYEDRYVLIGGTALWLLLDDAGLRTRATKDLDIVLCVEALDTAFVNAFWQFIKDGDYLQHEKSSGRKIFYRFLKPRVEDYPAMLELFSRQPDGITLEGDAHLTPIPAGEEASSLSAILLDDDYYRLVHSRKRMLEGVSLVDEACLLLLKARAWLDLVARKQAGEPIDGREINKHRNDVLRLYQVLDPMKTFKVSGSVARDFGQFLARVAPEIDAQLLRNLDIRNVQPEEVLQAVGDLFIGTAEAPA